MKVDLSKTTLILTAILGVTVLTTWAQPSVQSSPELIVRPAPEAESSLRQKLDGRAPQEKNADPLFEGVESISSVVLDGKEEGAKASATTSFSAYTLRVRDSTSFRRLLSRWSRHPNVRYAHPNYEFEIESASAPPGPLGPNNTLADSLNHLEVVRASDAWSVTTGSENVEIGIVDTGFYLDHPDLSDQFAINDAEDLNDNQRFDEGDLNGVDDDGNGFVDDVIGYDFVDRAAPVQEGEFENRDPDPSADPLGSGSGHGTAVAGVAGSAPGSQDAGIAGVAPGAELVPLRAFGGDGIGQSDDIAAAIVYGATRGVDVLNLSFGRNRSTPVIKDAIEFATDQGTVVVASAGNELTDESHYPSDYPNVLSVVWLAEDGGGVPQFNRSQFGIGVDLGAPGSNVYSAHFPAQSIRSGDEPAFDELYQSVSGSSFSAPQVAGAAALLRSADSSLSPASVRSILTASTEDIEAENWDHTTGAGLLDVSQALGRAYPARTELTSPEHDEGIATRDEVPIVGTALDPSFAHYAVYVAEGTSDLDDRQNPWTQITSQHSRQALRDTLGTWEVSDWEEGVYTLRLVTTLRDGRTIEDRRRVFIDRSPPSIGIEFLGTGRVDGENGIIGHVQTDDLTRLTAAIQFDGNESLVQSDQEARIHGLSWPEEEGIGGEARVRIEATNTSNLTTTLDTTVQIPPSQENTALLERKQSRIPRGRLLPVATDFDKDGLREVLLNQSKEGGLSDSLRSFEWAGTEFAPADTLIATLFPKDVGNTDGNDLQELLLQVRGGTLLLEQATPTAFPDQLVFADTIGSDTPIDEVFMGVRLADVTGSGTDEIVGTTGREWVILERSSDGFDRLHTMDNPTTRTGRDSVNANAFDEPEALVQDFDADGHPDLLVGDRDGDVIVYEFDGRETVEVAWTYETDRVDAGNRFAAGDLTGEPGTEFVTMTTYYPKALEEGEYEPAISFYSVWQATGDNVYERVYRLPVTGPYVRQGSMTATDVDGDGQDEVILSHAPSLMILDYSSANGWRVLHENREERPLQSRSLLASDFSGNGWPSIMAETAGDRLARFVVDEDAVEVSPPRWVRARPVDPSTSGLVWRAPGADSVAVYGGSPEEELNLLTVVSDSSVTIDGTSERRFALRAWEDSTRSPLSSDRTIRPHAPATLTEIDYPSAQSVELTFSEQLRRTTSAPQFSLGDEGRPPSGFSLAHNGRSVVLRFSGDVAGQSFPLEWSALRDRDGLAVADTGTTVTFPAPDERSLFVETAEILGERRVRLVFSEPLDPSVATEVGRYDLRPRGHVSAVELTEEDPKVVTLQLEGLVIGATGQEASVKVTDMQSRDGTLLADEGGTVRLTEPADDLSNVFVYPNPYRAYDHDGTMTIAGLPKEATVRIYAPEGRLVQVLSVEGNRRGGSSWDLRDRRGERVPSGVYLFRVNAPGHSPVLEKAAVIR